MKKLTNNIIFGLLASITTYAQTNEAFYPNIKVKGNIKVGTNAIIQQVLALTAIANVSTLFATSDGLFINATNGKSIIFNGTAGSSNGIYTMPWSGIATSNSDILTKGRADALYGGGGSGIAATNGSGTNTTFYSAGLGAPAAQTFGDFNIGGGLTTSNTSTLRSLGAKTALILNTLTNTAVLLSAEPDDGTGSGITTSVFNFDGLGNLNFQDTSSNRFFSITGTNSGRIHFFDNTYGGYIDADSSAGFGIVGWDNNGNFNASDITSSGKFYGNGGGLTDIPATALTGNITTNLSFLTPGLRTNTLYITNGIIGAVSDP